MIKIFQKRINDSKVNEVSEFRPGSWIYVKDPNEQEFAILEKNFCLNPNILRDALDPYEVPRVEKEKEIVYIFTRVPQKQDEKIITVPLLICVGSDFVMTLSRSENLILNRFLENNIDFTTTQKTQLLLLFISETIKSYNAFLTNISRDVRETSGKLNKINEKIIINFVHFEEVVNDFFASLTHISPVLQNIISGKLIELYKEDHELTEDLVVSSNQLVELCKSTLKNIVNIREAYSTIVTNDLNRVIKLFTSLTVILTIPTIIASLYGMNVALPFSNNPDAFWLVGGVTIIIVLVVFWIFNRNRWL
jgi:magnesium transporter